MKSLRCLAGVIATFLAFTAGRAADGGWETLFDGVSLQGWKASEHPDSVRVDAGRIFCDGPRAHLFYVGPDGKADFENFELQLEVMPLTGANSGVYFHATWQDSGWPRQSGFEIQVDNDQPPVDQGYEENKKTGSLYGVRNLYKAAVRDNEWFTMDLLVRRPRVEVRLNGRLVLEYTEASNPVVAAEGTTLDLLSHGTFALQCHDAASKAYFRNIRVRRLPPGEDAAVRKPVLTDADRRLQLLGKENFPVLDLHANLRGGLNVERILAIGDQSGLRAGVPFAGLRDDAAARELIEKWRDSPVFVGLQLEPAAGAKLSAATLAQFDYVLAVAPRPSDVTEAALDRAVDQTVALIENQPIDVISGATALPPTFLARGDGPWSDARMQRIIDAAVAHGVAFEINAHAPQPSEKFLRLAKAAHAKFAIGSDNGSPAEFGDWSYALAMQEKLKLGWRDMYVPGHHPTRAQAAAAKSAAVKN